MFTAKALVERAEKLIREHGRSS